MDNTGWFPISMHVPSHYRQNTSGIWAMQFLNYNCILKVATSHANIDVDSFTNVFNFTNERGD
jgi:hypothetical protein